ncbi:MAG TPA: helix-turn-helix transcriptional regulator, partial [Candidatus Saccharimonadales bacterium]
SDPDAWGQLYDARICNDISIDLYELRKKSGLTQKELADKLQVKQSNISRWEKPGYQGYKVKMLSKLVRMLGGQLFISIQPLKNFQYLRATFEMQHEITKTFRPDGTLLQTSSKLKTKSEELKVIINASY